MVPVQGAVCKATNRRPPAEGCVNRYRAHIDLEQGEVCVCVFCTETETLAPLLGQHPRLSSLFDIIKKKKGFRVSLFFYSFLGKNPVYKEQKMYTHW